MRAPDFWNLQQKGASLLGILQRPYRFTMFWQGIVFGYALWSYSLLGTLPTRTFRKLSRDVQTFRDSPCRDPQGLPANFAHAGPLQRCCMLRSMGLKGFGSRAPAQSARQQQENSHRDSSSGKSQQHSDDEKVDSHGHDNNDDGRA